MKRIKLLTSLMLVVLLLTGCGSSKEKITYLAWNVGTKEENNLERQMIKAFEEENNVEVEILTPPVNSDGTPGNYEEFMSSLAASKDLPNVFMWGSVTDVATNGWSSDVSEYINNDENFKNVLPVLANGGNINGKQVGIPYALHMAGMFINYDIFDELNVEPLQYGYTMAQLEEAIAKTSVNENRGVDNYPVHDWYPAAVANLGFSGFDGKSYNFSSQEYAKGIEAAQNVLSNGYSGNIGLVGNEWLPEGVDAPWAQGYIANQYDFSWALQGFAKEEFPFKGDFIGLPGGKVVLVPDYIFVGANVENTELSYKLATWMSYDHAGMTKRSEIRKDTDNKDYYGIPLAAGSYPEIDAEFLATYQAFPEFIKMYNAISADESLTILEPFKVVPGYPLSRFNGDTGVVGKVGEEEVSMNMDQLINAIIKGEVKLADYAKSMDELANKYFAEANASIAASSSK